MSDSGDAYSKIVELYKDEIHKLHRRALVEGGRGHYSKKYYSLLDHLDKAGIITAERRDNSTPKGIYSFKSDFTIENINKFERNIKNDKEGINKKLSGFRFFNSGTVNEIVKINNKIKKIFKKEKTTTVSWKPK